MDAFPIETHIGAAKASLGVHNVKWPHPGYGVPNSYFSTT